MKGIAMVIQNAPAHNFIGREDTNITPICKRLITSLCHAVGLVQMNANKQIHLQKVDWEYIVFIIQNEIARRVFRQR